MPPKHSSLRGGTRRPPLPPSPLHMPPSLPGYLISLLSQNAFQFLTSSSGSTFSQEPFLTLMPCGTLFVLKLTNCTVLGVRQSQPGSDIFTSILAIVHWFSILSVFKFHFYLHSWFICVCLSCLLWSFII